MAKNDSLGRTFPVRTTVRTGSPGSSSQLNAFEKQLERGFRDLERAIGDLYNTENASNSVLSDSPLHINSLGRALGSMSEIVPPVGAVEVASPALAARLADATYNVIPHPDQTVRCEVGCRFDSLVSSDSTARSCLRERTSFYRQKFGAQTGVCQNNSCPDWSGRAQRITLDTSNRAGETFRDYKLVNPPELRTVERFAVRYYSNCGTQFDRYRIDGGTTSYGDNRSDPQQTWSLANDLESTTDGITPEVRYEYRNLTTTNGHIVVVEVPAVETSQIVLVNGIPQATIRGTTTEPTRWLFDLTGLSGSTSLLVTAKPTAVAGDAIAAISQIWVIEKTLTSHRNYGEPLLLPKALEGLSSGAEIPPNFLQVFDTDPSINRVIDQVSVYATRFNPKSPTANSSSHRDAFDLRVWGDQQLEIGNDRYLGVTVGTDVATAVGALLDAFIEHVSDSSIHLNSETICQLLANPQFCCEGTLQVELERLSPPTRVSYSPPTTYAIRAYVYGGNPPYTVTIDWGDDSTDVDAGIVSGIQAFDLSADVHPADGTGEEFSHVYQTSGTFTLAFDVMDDPSLFGCEATLTPQVSPFNVGAPPQIDSEIRLDYATSYPNFVFRDITDGTSFIETPVDDWTSAPIYHVITQIHNTDLEDGKPREFSWSFANPAGLTFQFYYEYVTQVLDQALVIANTSGYLGQTLIQQDSVALVSGSRSYDQDTDFTVDWATGWVTVITSGSLPSSATLEASFHYYQDASDAADTANEWVALGSTQSGATIALSDLTSRTDLNTIRFKVKE